MRRMVHGEKRHSALVRSVARATGESVLEISRRGFHSAMPLDVRFDPEPSASARSCDEADDPPEVVDLAEYGIDWEALLDESLEQGCELNGSYVGGAA